jgi:hypothetical protein
MSESPGQGRLVPLKGAAREPALLCRAARRREPALMLQASTDLVLGSEVQEDAVFVGALSEVGEEPALGHAVPIKLVQEVAVVALLAQPTQPVLTHDLVPPRVDPHAGRRLRLRFVGLDAEHGVEVHANLV